MKALTQNLVTGLVAATLATYGVGSVLAAPPKPHPVPGGHWHHSAPAHFHHAPPYHPAHHSYHPVVVHHRPGPVVVLGAAAVPYAEPVVDTSNPAPASIRLVNPVENQLTAAIHGQWRSGTGPVCRPLYRLRPRGGDPVRSWWRGGRGPLPPPGRHLPFPSGRWPLESGP